ncbi:hypothetical protein [Stigmatella hybrida]|uniref:hypothetical protein n=1 Tax=Stigmatella hybrida TaxID=394097 RepID=UPI001CDAE0D9|nr:hypothetical protein [Stigmatella hybrida]
MKRLFFAPLALWGLGACGGSFLFWRKPERLDIERICAAKGAAASEPGAIRAEMELLNVRYDGKSLFGRLLVSPVEKAVCLDKRLIESLALNLESVSECGTGRKLGFMVVDVLAKPLSEENVLAVSPGYWYGKEIILPLFPERGTEQLAPDCIDVEFSLHALIGGQVARLRVQASRDPQHLGVEDYPVDLQRL